MFFKKKEGEDKEAQPNVPALIKQIEEARDRVNELDCLLISSTIKAMKLKALLEREQCDRTFEEMKSLLKEIAAQGGEDTYDGKMD